MVEDHCIDCTSYALVIVLSYVSYCNGTRFVMYICEALTCRIQIGVVVHSSEAVLWGVESAQE